MRTAARLAALAILLLFAGAERGVARELARMPADLPPGAILIDVSERALYLALGEGAAIRYRVAVPRAGKEWFGWRRIDGIHVAPAWTPPPEVRRHHPHLPDLIAGGDPANPMGAAALTLDDGITAIHGTTRAMRASIGTAASFGCIRMRDEDVLDLMARVRVGTPVVKIP